MENQQLVKDAAECALKFLDGYSSDNKMTLAYAAFKALAELTVADLDSGEILEKCRYEPLDISKKNGQRIR